MQSLRRMKKVEGAKFTISVGAIAADGRAIIDLSREPYGLYAPYDYISIFNDSSSKVYVYPNQDTNLKIPVAGKTSTSRGELHIWNIMVVEQSGSAISAGEIQIIIEVLPASADTLARRFADKIYGLVG